MSDPILTTKIAIVLNNNNNNRMRTFANLLSLLLTAMSVSAQDTITSTHTLMEVEETHTATRKVALTNGRKSQCQQLWAKQGVIPVGSVCLEVDHRNPEQLIVGFQTKDGWRLDDAHLWIGKNITDLPLDEVNEPPTGPLLDLFTYKKDDLVPGQHSNFGFVVKLWNLDFSCPDSQGTEFAAAAHATVRARSAVRGGENPTQQSAWAAAEAASTAEQFQQKFLDFSFTLTCDLMQARPDDAPERHHANQVPS